MLPEAAHWSQRVKLRASGSFSSTDHKPCTKTLFLYYHAFAIFILIQFQIHLMYCFVIIVGFLFICFIFVYTRCASYFILILPHKRFVPCSLDLQKHTLLYALPKIFMSPQLAIKAFVLIIKYRGCQLEYTNFIYWIVKCMYKRCLHQCDLKKYNEQYLDIFVNVHFWLLFKRVKHRNSVK